MTNGDAIKAILKPRTDQIKIYGDWVEIEIQSLAINFNCELSWWEAEYEESPTKNDLGVDAVSRDAVLDLVADYDLSMGQVVKGIHALPPVTPQEPRWIPVSERLPEEDESVLLTICANSALYGFNENFVKVMCGSYSPCEDKRDWIVNGIRYYIDNVIAWMPLPQAYSEVEE